MHGPYGVTSLLISYGHIISSVEWINGLSRERLTDEVYLHIICSLCRQKLTLLNQSMRNLNFVMCKEIIQLL